MQEPQLILDNNKKGAFFIKEGNEELGRMEVGIIGNVMTVFHTEVLPKAEGQGLAKKLFMAMVDHALKNGFTVKALCPYALAQFKRHATDYATIWKDND
jgi:predicted GNAT family acetyltransferase